MATWETTTHRLIRFAKLIADCLRCRRPHWLDPTGIVAGSRNTKRPPRTSVIEVVSIHRCPILYR